MKCARCKKDLKPYELAAPMRIRGEKVSMPSLCDDCSRETQAQPGTAKARAK